MNVFRICILSCFIFILFLGGLEEKVSACPACKDSIEQAVSRSGKPATNYHELSSTEKAYSWSVLVMLFFPLLFIGSIITYGMKLQAEYQNAQKVKKDSLVILTNRQTCATLKLEANVSL